ncbi:MAG: GTPase Era [Myxococcota bacterium]
MAERAHRAGVVALLGRPNAGKSRLLNRLLGEKLAIVTALPQTTRSRILGILSRPEAQLLLLDTPGFHASEKPLNRAMAEMVEEASRGCDVAAVLVDPRRGLGEDHRTLLAGLARRGTSTLLVATQCDRPAAAAAPWPPEGAPPGMETLRISAATGEGVEELVAALVARLPVGPPLHPEDDLTDRSLRFLAAELVREAAFEELSQELPYALAVEVERFDESNPALVHIEARVLVERDSQKRIVVGSGGGVVKRIGMRARREIEQLLGTRVHLALWVKAEPRWARRPNRLKALGYH